MADFLAGLLGFLKEAATIVAVLELTSLFDEFFSVWFQLRKGFTGTKTTPGKIFVRHALIFLRADGTTLSYFSAGAKALVLFVAAALMPAWSGGIIFDVPHSLWIFLLLMIWGPCAHLVCEWVLRQGAGWPAVLTAAERAIGGATVLFILAITLVAITGADSFAEFSALQSSRGWLVASHPLVIPLVFAFAIMSLFSSFQEVFSRTGDARQGGWSFNDVLPSFRRSIWSLFIADVFLGGAAPGGPAGAVLLVLKAVAVNVLSSVVAKFFFQMREDQAEALILWKLAPLSIIILAVTLLFPGALT